MVFKDQIVAGMFYKGYFYVFLYYGTVFKKYIITCTYSEIF